MPAQDCQEAIDALTFPKLKVRQGTSEYAGYLTDLSAKLILVELERQGFQITKTDQR